MLQGYYNSTYEALVATGGKAVRDSTKFLDTVHGKAIVATTATYALAKAIQAVSDKYNLSYDSSIKNTKQSLDGLQSTKNEIENLKSKAESYKQTLMSMGETYNIEFTGSETMVDMITKLRQVKDISLTDSAELTKITQENAALERQLELKEKLVTTEQKKAADNARAALEKGTKSVAQEVAVDVEGGNGSLVIGDETISFTAKATYEEGEIKNNNLGEPSPDGHVLAGSVTSSAYNIIGQRNAFWGSGVGKFEDISSDKIRTLTNKRLNLSANTNIALKVESGQQYIAFALPSPRTLKQVIYDDLGDKGMLASFVKSTIQVADARGEQNGLKDYNCYVYNLNTPAAAPMNFTFVIG